MQNAKDNSVPSLRLPSNLPDKRAIKSEDQYFPEEWQREYSVYEYLGSLSIDALCKRHNDILRNMRALTSSDRDIIPIESPLSSWYWYRKEHQTRCEMAKRGIKLPDALSDIPLEVPTNHSVLYRPAHPNASDVLYRYGALNHCRDLLTKGEFQLKPASEMSKYEGDAARYDIETEKSRFTQGEHVKITTESGQIIPVIGDVTHTTSLPNYYLYCTSADYDDALLAEFGGACVIIKNPEEFSRRLEKWGGQYLVGWNLYDLPVEYYDPYEPIRNQRIDAGFYKRIEFAYQREFRFVFHHPRGVEAQETLTVKLGNIEDIAELAV